MTTERDRIRDIIVVTFSPSQFQHWTAGTRPPGAACQKEMERIRQHQLRLQRDGIGAPVEIRVRETEWGQEPEPPPADGE